MSYNSIETRRDYRLSAVLLYLYHGCSKCVFLERAEKDNEGKGEQYAADCLGPEREFRAPSEALRVEWHNCEPNQKGEEKENQQDFIPGFLLPLHRRPEAFFEQRRVLNVQ